MLPTVPLMATLILLSMHLETRMQKFTNMNSQEHSQELKGKTGIVNGKSQPIHLLYQMLLQEHLKQLEKEMDGYK